MTDTTEQSSRRWAGPVSASSQLNPEQAQRVQAIRAAREVLETSSGGSPFARPSLTAPSPATELMQVAEWITSGTLSDA